jgi:hypothetical protein
MNSDVRTMITPDSVSQFFIEEGSMDFIVYFLYDAPRAFRSIQIERKRIVSMQSLSTPEGK